MTGGGFQDEHCAEKHSGDGGWGGRRSRPQGHHMIIDESVHKGEYELTTREPEELPSLA